MASGCSNGQDAKVINYMVECDMAEKLAQKLIALHNFKYDLLKEMYEATLARSQIIDTEKVDQILKTMDVRQKCIDRVDVMDVEIYEISQSLETLINIAGEINPNDCIDPEMKEIERLKREQHKLVGKMLELDREQNRQLNLAFEELKAYRKKIRLGRKTLTAYRSKKTGRPSVFLDEKK